MTTTLEQSKRLKELDVRQEGKKWWVTEYRSFLSARKPEKPFLTERERIGFWDYDKKREQAYHQGCSGEHENCECPVRNVTIFTAFTTDELLGMMPECTRVTKIDNDEYVAKVGNTSHGWTDDTPAQALGALLIRLLEEGVVKAEDL